MEQRSEPWFETRINSLERFMSKVEKTDTCWIWKAQIVPSGYGKFWLNENMTAHRASWILHYGEIPIGLWILHKCDNYSCVNPDHLFLGTPRDNTQDMISKGRQIFKEKILTQNQEDEIYILHEKGVTQREIAKVFNVHQRTIWRIIHKKFPIVKMIGEGNNKAILTEEKVKEMRSMYQPRKMGFHRIAKKFGIEKSTAMRAIKGVTWKHI